MKAQRILLRFLEIAISSAIIIYFSTKIIDPFFPQFRPLRVENKTIYLRGVLNSRPTSFLNLISFDYTDFISKFPPWNEERFSKAMEESSLILTKHRLSDFSNSLLKLNIPYWQEGAVKISLEINGEWVTLDKIISCNKPVYSLEDVIFLGLGMDNLDIRYLKEIEFITSYFTGRGFKIKDSFPFSSRRIIVKLSPN